MVDSSSLLARRVGHNVFSRVIALSLLVLSGSCAWAAGQSGSRHSNAAIAPSRYDVFAINADLHGAWQFADGRQLWAVGDNGAILRFAMPAGRWEVQPATTISMLLSIFRTNDGANLWAVGEKGTVLHYSAQNGLWEAQASIRQIASTLSSAAVMAPNYGQLSQRELFYITRHERTNGRW